MSSEYTMSSDVLSLVENLTDLLIDFWPITLRIGYFIGLILFACAVLMATTPKNRMMMQTGLQALPDKACLFTLFAAIMLMNLPAWLYHLSDSVFRSSTLTVLSYQTLNPNVKTTDELGKYITFAVTVVMFTGLITLLRSLIMLQRSGSDPNQFWGAVSYAAGGCLATNFALFMSHLGESLGGVYKAQIDKFF